jgi:hypothetical protein
MHKIPSIFTKLHRKRINQTTLRVDDRRAVFRVKVDVLDRHVALLLVVERSCHRFHKVLAQNLRDQSYKRARGDEFRWCNEAARRTNTTGKRKKAEL